MNILLISPYHDKGSVTREDFTPSAALMCLAAVLREAGHSPTLLDLNSRKTQLQPNPKRYSEEQIQAALTNTNPDLVGVSFLFSGMFEAARQCASWIKQIRPGTKIATGGIHATTFPKQILSNCPEFDYIALGEGETQIVELANRMDANNTNDLSDINSFAFRKSDGSIFVNSERKLLDFGQSPMQAWDMINFSEYEMDLSNYFDPKGHKMKNIVPLISERGCPYRCNFCDMYIIQGRKIRRRSAKQFVNEVEYLVKERGQRYFSFMDDNLTLDNRHIITICQEIISRKLDIQFETCGGLCVNSLSDEVIDYMVEAGMISALIAPEHGSEYIRNSIIGKNLKTEKIYSVVQKLQTHKVLIGANWIMGFPEETDETLTDMMNMIHALKADRNWVGALIPFPGTKVFEQCVKDELFVDQINIDTLWKTPIRPHQGHCMIKPYNLDMRTLESWRQKFEKIRYQYFGHFHPDFKLPKGYERISGEVRPTGTSECVKRLGEGRP